MIQIAQFLAQKCKQTADSNYYIVKFGIFNMTQNLHRKVKHHLKKIFTFRIMMSYISNEVHFIYALKDIILHFFKICKWSLRRQGKYMCVPQKITSWSKSWHELHITNFRCEKKMTIFRFFLEKLQIGGNNFSKVINTTVDLIKIVSNHSEVKSEKKCNLGSYIFCLKG